MSRLIRCDKCNTKVADIRDGSLIKGIVCYCAKCNKDMRAKIAAASYYSSTKSSGNTIKDILGGAFE